MEELEFITEEVTEIEVLEESLEVESSAPALAEELETLEIITEEVTEIEVLEESLEVESSAPALVQESDYAVTVISDSVASDDVVILLQEQNQLIQNQTDAINYNCSMITFIILVIWVIKSVKSSVFKMTNISRKGV